MPLGSFGQKGQDSLNSELNGEIYSIMRLVIKQEKLNKTYGLELSPALNCNINNADTAYLQTLLIKPKQVDASKKEASTGPLHNHLHHI